ncbi:YueI family protein [Limosilactobacillus sp.]|uniref:YueI family protein n=1 Tax=Limosilactobacillus sp. TaxID=2773925 RepID=UPI003F10DC9E
MAEEKKSAVEQRIDNAVYGTPKIKPDEQRKYLGTFRERVCLTISVTQLHTQNWEKAVTSELAKGIGQLVFINGNLPHEEVHPYIQAAARAGATFTMKTEPEFKTDPTALAVVVASKTAVYQSPVDVQKRYPQLVATAPAADQPTPSTKKRGLLTRLFHREGR